VAVGNKKIVPCVLLNWRMLKMFTKLNNKEIFAVSGGITGTEIASSIVIGAALSYGGKVVHDCYVGGELNSCLNDLNCFKKLAIDVVAKAMTGVQFVIPAIPVALTAWYVYRCFTTQPGHRLGNS
jgi:hypothetical protein